MMRDEPLSKHPAANNQNSVKGQIAVTPKAMKNPASNPGHPVA